MSEQTTRRQLLVGTGSVFTVAVAGCLTTSDSEDPDKTDRKGNSNGKDRKGNSNGKDGSGSDETLSPVPAGVDVLVGADIEQILADEVFDKRIQEITENAQVGRTVTVEQLLDRVESDLGLDPRKISGALLFGKLNSDPYVGGVIETDWTEKGVRRAVGDPVSTHRGQPVYEQSSTALGMLPDGRYVVGQMSVVRETIDVATDNADPVGNRTLTAFDSAPEGYLRMGFTLSKQVVSNAKDIKHLSEFEYGTLGLYREDRKHGGEMRLSFTSKTAAEYTVTQLQKARTRFRNRLDETDLSGLKSDIGREINQTSISKDGTTVTISNENGEGWLMVLPLTVLLSFVLGFGNTPENPAPQAAFEFEWEQNSLTIIHEAGDSIPAKQLEVQVDGSTLGTWKELGDGSPEVAAGDSLTVEPEPGSTVRVVWEAASGDRSAVLAMYEVPE